MPSIGHDRERMGEDTADRLDDHKNGCKNEGPSQHAGASALGVVVVRVIMAVPMIIVSTAVSMGMVGGMHGVAG